MVGVIIVFTQLTTGFWTEIQYQRIHVNLQIYTHFLIQSSGFYVIYH